MGIRGQAESAQLVDVNGDGRLDLVRVGVRSVHVRLANTSGSGVSVLGLPLRAGAWLAVGDATGDGTPDLYVVQGCRNGTNQPDLLLVNDGAGRFTSVATPEATDGCGGYAAPIDDGDGRADFIVLNGQGRFDHERMVGPVQLITVG
jgi:VCBS repeat protein